MGTGDLQSLQTYLIKNHRSFAKELQNEYRLDECVILSKCNCVEIYYVAAEDNKDGITNLWKKQSQKPNSFKISDICQYSGKKVIEHLFETACGLKSVTLGDNQVTGQVRQAISIASDDKTAGIVLKTIFNNARKVSNAVRNATDIGKGNVSAERTAVDMMIKRSIPQDAYILIVGAGSTGSLLCKVLNEKGYKNLVIANRTINKAKKLVKDKIAKKAVRLNTIKNLKVKPIIIFFATPNVFKKEQLDFLSTIKYCLIYDLGTPQNTLLVKNLYEIYDLKSINEYSQYNKKLRQNSISIAKDIISTSVTKAVDAMIYSLKENARRENFRINSEIYKSKIPNIKLKSDAYFITRKTLLYLGFVEIHTPTITAVSTDPVRDNPDEEIFTVNWYGRKMLLRQSNQLYKQILILSGIDKLFELGPFWRAELNPTPRHLSEAYGLDIEMANVENLNQLIALLGTLLNVITKKLYENKEISKSQVVNKTIKTITYEDALSLLNSKGTSGKVAYGIDFGYDLEEMLGKIVKDKYKTDLFAIIKYPSSVKKFYVKHDREDKTLSFDVIYKGWEIASGAIRETDYEKLLKGIKGTGLKHKKYQFYLNAFQNPRPHGGFCLSIDRFLVKLLNLRSLSDLFLFPRSEYDIIP